MKCSDTAMLLATIAGGVIATAAQAQQIPAPTDTYLRGAGASSIQNVLVQELNCIGDSQQLGTSAGALTTIPEINFTNPPYSAAFNCATQEVQPDFAARYVATGSGFGRQAWRLNSYQFAPTTSGVANPFVTTLGDSTASWSHVQFAFSDGGASPSDIQAYNNATTGASTLGGKAIQFPLYVLPVAIAYDPTYGRNTTTGETYTFNVANPQSINGVAAGGLRMSRNTYCKVFNGTIVNFNDAAFTADNGGTSLRNPNDSTTRWNADGVPVRLVGRLDRSGTTDIFTRALAAQCNGVSGLTNKYTANAESLPYARVSGAPDFSAIRSDTGYSPASTAPVAGSTNLIGNQYFSGSAILSVAGGNPSHPTGANGSGLFLVADGSGRTRDAIRFAPDYASPSASNVLLNGKIGYIGSDFVAGSESATAAPLFAAALQTGSSFVMPSATAAVNAISTILPPESAATSGAWLTGDARSVRNPNGGANVPATRANPLAWYDVLYSGTTTLANPTTGYALTGTTQFLGHQCYAAGNRQNMVEFIADTFDRNTTTSTGAALPAGMFAGTTSTAPGLLARSNIGALPTVWRNAIVNTFLSNSTQVDSVSGATLGSQNLWIQSANSRASTTTTNPTVCGGVTGA